MLDFARKLSIPSAVSYLFWRARGSAGPIGLALRSGVKFELRGDGANNDYGVAYEIFVHDYYGDSGRLPSGEVKLIVDLGANVGYSVLYFLHRHPLARVIAFEPHPAHAVQVEKNLTLDGSRDRVELHRKAAGAKTRTMMLTDAKSSSTLTTDASKKTMPVEVMDIFPLLEGKHIDVLKMDIEGGEYEIMADDRFAMLDIGTVVMEWHSRGGGAEDRRWCEERLRSLGFTIEEIFTRSGYGMFWARR
jgi:FkbM family methyltransferase